MSLFLILYYILVYCYTSSVWLLFYFMQFIHSINKLIVVQHTKWYNSSITLWIE
jgi:hypothetical protein